MSLRDSVFAVVAAQLGQEGDGLLGSAFDQFAQQPRHGLREHGALVVQVGREQIAHRRVDREPAGVEAPDQLVGAREGVERSTQRGQRVTVVEPHAARV